MKKIDDLPEPYRSLAQLRRKERSQAWSGDGDCLDSAFSWRRSPEGHAFWDQIENGIRSTWPVLPMDSLFAIKKAKSIGLPV